MGVQFAASPGDLGEQFRGGRGLGVAAYGLAVQVQCLADRGGPDTSVVQGVDFRPPLPGQVGSASFGDGGRWRRLCDGVLFGLIPQAFAVGAHHFVHGVGQVVEQVKPVGDLDGLGSPESGSFGVGAATVTADHLGAGVGA
ncbi:hypothetical protein ADK67_36780 [Saccharothrix sp. NRRL B-16348]|nr:hypothetical protein ADK67_36780 [Saccharothrix sp. NRRL B-16348]